jgi:polar amino acid transport system substrate-binding protein
MPSKSASTLYRGIKNQRFYAWRTGMKIWLQLAVLVMLSPSLLPAASLRILTEDLPPLNYVKDDVLMGPSVEMVREIQRRIGSTEAIEVYPWARAYHIALEEKNVVLFGVSHTPPREDKFKWVGPLATKRDILVAKKGSNLVITSLEDAKKVRRIGVLRDDTKEEFLERHAFTNLEPVSDERKNAQKLVMGRIDLWVFKKPGLKTVCELAGVDYDAVEEVFHLRETNVDIAFSIMTPDAVVAQWRAAFSEMVADGTVAAIRRKWDVE